MKENKKSRMAKIIEHRQVLLYSDTQSLQNLQGPFLLLFLIVPILTAIGIVDFFEKFVTSYCFVQPQIFRTIFHLLSFQIFFHFDDWDSLHQHVSPDVLPPEYGGTAPFDPQQCYKDLFEKDAQIAMNLAHHRLKNV